MATVLAATGRSTLDDAVTWMAAGLNLAAGTDLNLLLQALVLLRPGEPDGTKALAVIARRASLSELDSAAVLFTPNAIIPAAKFRAALDALAAGSPERHLGNINASAVIAAQRANPFVVQTLCAVAGLSYGDLLERVPGLPPDPASPWTPSQVRDAFALVDDVVEDRVRSRLPGTIPTRPLDLMPTVVGPIQPGGWARIESQAKDGVPYEVLLAQRAAGGTWLAHRNATSGLLNHSVADELCDAMDAAGIEYRRSTALGGTTPPSEIQAMANSDKQVGIVVLDRSGRPAYAVAFGYARDSGTARKSAASLAAMKRDQTIPIAAALSGPGWSHRNETADLAIAFDGRLFSDATIPVLVRDINDVLGLSGLDATSFSSSLRQPNRRSTHRQGGSRR
jgi:hypothetical protein